MLKKIRKMLKSQEGFTLVELMIVVVILGILAGVGIQQYGQIQERAREGVDEANVRLIKSAAQMYLMAEKDIETGDDLLEALVDANYLEDMIYSPWDSNEHYVVKIQEDDGGSYSIEVKPFKPNSDAGGGSDNSDAGGGSDG